MPDLSCLFESVMPRPSLEARRGVVTLFGKGDSIQDIHKQARRKVVNSGGLSSQQENFSMVKN